MWKPKHCDYIKRRTDVYRLTAMGVFVQKGSVVETRSNLDRCFKRAMCVFSF